MVLLRRLLPRKAARVVEALSLHLLMIAVIAPFFFVFFYMFWNSVKPDYLFFEPQTWSPMA